MHLIEVLAKLAKQQQLYKVLGHQAAWSYDQVLADLKYLQILNTTRVPFREDTQRIKIVDDTCCGERSD